MGIFLKVLKASEGECIIIKIVEDNKCFNIIVDSGVEETYFDNGLKEEITKILENDKENIDLLILTHIDDDHIEGIKAFFEDEEIDRNLLKMKIKNIWFNSAKVISDFCNCEVNNDIRNREVYLRDKSCEISKGNATSLEMEMVKLGINLKVIKALDTYYIGDSCSITILSPNKESLRKLDSEWTINDKISQISGTRKDYDKSISELLRNDKFTSRDRDKSVTNGASIAFLLRYTDKYNIDKTKTILMLGDSHENIIRESLNKLGYDSINKLKVDVVKLSHHGSDRNTSPQLLEMLECERYIISTDGSLHGLPRKKSIARVISSNNKPIKIYFNYNLINLIFGNTYECEKINHKFECIQLERLMEV